MGSKKPICVRCEALERRQQSKTTRLLDGVTICDVCLQEIILEEDLFGNTEEDEQGSEDLD